MTDQKKQIRPTIPSISIQNNFSEEEKFQNNILRPIIKLQHNLILSYFEEYIKRDKININELDQARMKALIQKLFKSNNRLKIELRGLIIGLFTIDEFKEYSNQSSKINKRINNIIEQRIISFYFN
tara:strand:- start:201 stop:578 length:378 start_codon:yes stop_codon:yes gene_type:complete